MKYNLDANALIYLIKSKTANLFVNLVNKDVVVDTSVYKEAIEDGIEKGYPDANLAKKWLEQYRIPVIPIDISPMLSKFKDPGETSCYLLGKEGSICISSDIRALKKLKRMNIQTIQLDSFFFSQFRKKMISKKEFIGILDKLEVIYATLPERKLVFLQNIKDEEKNE